MIFPFLKPETILTILRVTKVIASAGDNRNFAPKIGESALGAYNIVFKSLRMETPTE
jgi:hypothetical protein